MLMTMSSALPEAYIVGWVDDAVPVMRLPSRRSTAATQTRQSAATRLRRAGDQLVAFLQLAFEHSGNFRVCEVRDACAYLHRPQRLIRIQDPDDRCLHALHRAYAFILHRSLRLLVTFAGVLHSVTLAAHAAFAGRTIAAATFPVSFAARAVAAILPTATLPITTTALSFAGVGRVAFLGHLCGASIVACRSCGFRRAARGCAARCCARCVATAGSAFSYRSTFAATAAHLNADLRIGSLQLI